MAHDINDPENLRGRLEKQLRKLEEADIDSRDKEAIVDYLEELKAERDNKPQTNSNHIKVLRLTSKRAETPLVEMEKPDVTQITNRLREDFGLTKATLNNYKASWRPFFKFQGKDWFHQIEFYNLEDEDVEKWRVFSEEEINAMLREAGPRSTVIIAVLADTGMRIGSLLSIPIENVHLDNRAPVLQLNNDAPNKGAEGNIPLTFSRSYIASYLESVHPRPEEEGVAFIHLKEKYEEDGAGVCRPKRVREDIEEVMVEAGLEERRRKLHNFRHTAVSRWYRAGVPRSIIQHRTKWSDMEMLDNYEHLVEEDKDEMTAECFGLLDETETNDPSTPEDIVAECNVCGAAVREGSGFCPGCGNPLTIESAHEATDDLTSETVDNLADADAVVEEMDTATVVEKLINKNPELLESIDLD